MSETVDEAIKAAATEVAKKAGVELWEKKSRLLSLLGRAAEFLGLRSEAPAPDGKSRGILILGPGGTGKSTLARFLAGDVNVLLDPPGYYEPSFGVETVPLLGAPGVELVVMPGQARRLVSDLADLGPALIRGEYRGVIVVTDYGHHAVEHERMREHHLFTGKKREFVSRLVEAHRREELDVLDRLLPLLSAVTERVWVLVVVLKEDIWAGERAAVVRHYTEGEWGKRVAPVVAQAGDRLFMQTVFASLHTQNYTTRGGEMLRKTCAGYDSTRQRRSVEELARAFDSLMEWEERR